jgi:hypothetical protein
MQTAREGLKLEKEMEVPSGCCIGTIITLVHVLVSTNSSKTRQQRQQKTPTPFTFFLFFFFFSDSWLSLPLFLWCDKK